MQSRWRCRTRNRCRGAGLYTVPAGVGEIATGTEPGPPVSGCSACTSHPGGRTAWPLSPVRPTCTSPTAKGWCTSHGGGSGPIRAGDTVQPLGQASRATGTGPGPARSCTAHLAGAGARDEEAARPPTRGLSTSPTTHTTVHVDSGPFWDDVPDLRRLGVCDGTTDLFFRMRAAGRAGARRRGTAAVAELGAFARARAGRRWRSGRRPSGWRRAADHARRGCRRSPT